MKSFKMVEQENRYWDKIAHIYTYEWYVRYILDTMYKKWYKFIGWYNVPMYIALKEHWQDYSNLLVLVNEIDNWDETNKLKQIIGF